MATLRNRISGCAVVLFAAIWILIWSTATLLFDYGLATSAGRQVRALNYAQALGTITSSRVVTETDSEGSSSKAVVTFRYTVGGNPLTGNVVRYGSFDGPGDARRIVARFPAEANVTVYFNPANPSDSLLLPGLSSGHAFAALFMLPFNLVMLGSWLAAGDCLKSGKRRPWWILPRRTPEGFTLRLYSSSPFSVAVAAMFAVSFAAIFAVALGGMILPAEWLVAAAWVAVVAVPIWLGLRQRKRAVLFHVNELRGEFEIHDAIGRRPQLAGPLHELRGVLIRERSKRDSEGDVTRTYTIAVSLNSCRIRRSQRCLVTGWNETNARQLADWLSQRLRLPVTSPFAQKSGMLFS